MDRPPGNVHIPPGRNRIGHARHRHFNLPDDRRVVCGISFGFADNAHKVNSYRTSRASVADTVTFFDE